MQELALICTTHTHCCTACNPPCRTPEWCSSHTIQHRSASCAHLVHVTHCIGWSLSISHSASVTTVHYAHPLGHPFYTIAGSMACVCSNLAHMQWHDLPALRRRPAARLLIVVPYSLLSHPCSWYYTPSCSTMYCYPVLIGCSRPTVYGCTG